MSLVDSIRVHRESIVESGLRSKKTIAAKRLAFITRRQRRRTRHTRRNNNAHKYTTHIHNPCHSLPLVPLLPQRPCPTQLHCTIGQPTIALRSPPLPASACSSIMRAVCVACHVVSGVCEVTLQQPMPCQPMQPLVRCIIESGDGSIHEHRQRDGVEWHATNVAHEYVCSGCVQLDLLLHRPRVPFLAARFRAPTSAHSHIE